MFNWKKVSLILLASAALLSGCTQSNIVSPADGKIQGDGQPDTEIDKILRSTGKKYVQTWKSSI